MRPLLSRSTLATLVPTLLVSPLLAACSVDLVTGDTGGRVPGDSTFTWSRQLAPGAQLAIQNGDGAIDVRESPDGRVDVVATVIIVDRFRTASTVSFAVEETSGGVVACTLYDGARRCGDPARPANVEVRYVVRVPRGLRLLATTGNGELTIDAPLASLVATTGNGRITIVDVPGPIVATAGNGDVELRQTIARDADATLTTGNGAVTATLPPDFRGRIDASTGNGTVRSDFPLSPAGALDGRHLTGAIGVGGPLLRLTTGNGTITVRKG
jgi:hypothetical protein